MPLDSAGLVDDLKVLFEKPPKTGPQCAKGWADAMKSYASGIAPPSTAVTSAAATLETALAAAFATPAAAALMETAFLAFATAVGGGMAGFVPTPPTAPVGFAAQFLIQPKTHQAAAAAIGGIIDAWMKTGSSTPSSGGPAVFWT